MGLEKKIAALGMTTRNVEIALSSRDRPYVVARRNITAGSLIEVCPLVVLNWDEALFFSKSALHGLAYATVGGAVIPGGYASAYIVSSASQVNAVTSVNRRKRRMAVIARKDIPKGHPIIVSQEKDSELVPEEDITTGDPSRIIAERGYGRTDFGFTNPAFCRPPMRSDGLKVRFIPGKGFGTFATRHFSKGDLVETCYVAKAPEKDNILYTHSDTEAFLYAWGWRNKLSAWPIGYPCFYNHSDKPNISPWKKLSGFDKKTHLAVRALRGIEPGDELGFDYYPGQKKKIFYFKVLP